jgi:hypothetical protein
MAGLQRLGPAATQQAKHFVSKMGKDAVEMCLLTSEVEILPLPGIVDQLPGGEMYAAATPVVSGGEVGGDRNQHMPETRCVECQ